MAASIGLNPVRAGIERDPADYRRSGCAEAVAGWNLPGPGLSQVAMGVLPSERSGETAREQMRRLLSGYRPSLAVPVGCSTELGREPRFCLSLASQAERVPPSRAPASSSTARQSPSASGSSRKNKSGTGVSPLGSKKHGQYARATLRDPSEPVLFRVTLAVGFWAKGPNYRSPGKRLGRQASVLNPGYAKIA
jgi:hypothetical protein